MMTAKQWFKRFRWGVFVPAAVYFVIGVMTAAMYPSAASEGGWRAYEFSVASLSLVAGACVVTYYFLGQDNAIALLSGVGAVSVAIYLFVPTLARRNVVPIALGISLILHAAAMFYGGIGMRKEKKAEFVARVVLGSVFAVLGVLSCVRLFDPSGNWVFAGVSYLACAVCSLVFGWLGGLLEEEEALKFRPVKKRKAEEEAPDKAPEEPAEEPQEEPAREGAPPKRGAHRH